MSNHRSIRLLPVVGGCMWSIVALQGAIGAEAQTDKGSYGVLSPTPDEALRDFAPDRPGRAISPFTVDAGRVQIESDFISFSRETQRDSVTRTIQAADPVLKLGLTAFMDFEVTLGGFVDLRTTGAMAEKTHGFGDITLTTKVNLIGNDGGAITFALAPYIIVPSGTRSISAGQVEGGLIAPLFVKLPQEFSLTLQAEIDALANVNGPGTHANFTNIVDMGHPIPGLKNLTGYVELYQSVTTERHAPDVYTFDLALAYVLETNTQLDVGANIGLNRGAPDYQLYTGIAHRF